MSTMPLDVVTPDRKVFGEEVEMVIVRGGDGDLGILPHHAPLATPLKPCVVRIRQDGEERKIAVSGGFLEVANNRVTILADAAELPEEIDVERARRAKERAEQRLANAETDTEDRIDVERARRALARANVRLEVAGKTGKRS
jgi:F-type H+-transporting ATPase subunit epsilon